MKIIILLIIACILLSDGRETLINIYTGSCNNTNSTTNSTDSTTNSTIINIYTGGSCNSSSNETDDESWRTIINIFDGCDNGGNTNGTDGGGGASGNNNSTDGGNGGNTNCTDGSTNCTDGGNGNNNGTDGGNGGNTNCTDGSTNCTDGGNGNNNGTDGGNGGNTNCTDGSTNCTDGGNGNNNGTDGGNGGNTNCTDGSTNCTDGGNGNNNGTDGGNGGNTNCTDGSTNCTDGGNGNNNGTDGGNGGNTNCTDGSTNCTDGGNGNNNGTDGGNGGNTNCTDGSTNCTDGGNGNNNGTDGGNGGNGNNNSTGNSTYHLFYDPAFFNGIGLDSNATNAFDRAIWDEILSRNPSIEAFIAPTYSVNNDLYKDFYSHVANCEMDGFATSTFIYPSLLESGIVATAPLFYVYNETYWTAFTNLPPLGDVTTGLCALEPNCTEGGLCSNYTIESIVEFATENDNVTIFICYSPNTLFYDYALLIQERFSNLSYTNVELFPFPSGKEAYLKLLKNISTIDPTEEIYYAIDPYYDDDFCYLLLSENSDNSTVGNDTSSSNLSIVYSPLLPAYPVSYVFCPEQTELIKMVNDTIVEMYNEKFICQLQVDILSYCVSESLDPNDNCGTLPDVPTCPSSNSTTNSTTNERRSFSNLDDWDFD